MPFIPSQSISCTSSKCGKRKLVLVTITVTIIALGLGLWFRWFWPSQSLPSIELEDPTIAPSQRPSTLPTIAPSQTPSTLPTTAPGQTPSTLPTIIPSEIPSTLPLVWKHLGQQINGKAPGDQLGYSVSLSKNGDVVAIGAINNDGNGYNSGHVQIYKYLQATDKWVQLGQDIDGEAQADQSGWSVSLSDNGNKIAIGAPYNSGNLSSSGHVRVYQYLSSSDKWVQFGQDIDGEAQGDELGWSISLSDDGYTLAAGAIGNDGYDLWSGHVRVYKYLPTMDKWVQLGQDIDGKAAWDESGWSVSLSGDGNTVAVGAHENDGNGSNSGHVRIFQYSFSSDIWEQLGPDLNGRAVNDESGYSLSLSNDGNTVAVGAPENNGKGSRSGYVRVYQYISSSNKWKQFGQDIDGELADDLSGWSISLSDNGNILAIGAPFNDGNGRNSGHVRVYKYSHRIEKWMQLGQDIDGKDVWNKSGSSLSLSGDGYILAVGAPDNIQHGPGFVQVYYLENI